MKNLLLYIMIFYITNFILLNSANNNDSRIYNIGFNIGTTGVGVEISTPIIDNLSLRGNINTIQMEYNQKIIYNKYKGVIKLFSSGLFLDYFVFNNKFKLSTGFSFNVNKYKSIMNINSGETIILNDNEYTNSDIYQINVEVFNKNNISPYLGIGWGNNIFNEKGWGLTFNIGLFYHGKPDSKIYIIQTENSETTKDKIYSDSKEERLKIIKKIKGYLFYPVATIGLTYTF